MEDAGKGHELITKECLNNAVHSAVAEALGAVITKFEFPERAY